VQDSGNGEGFFIDEGSLSGGKTVDRGLTRQPGPHDVLVALVIDIFSCEGDGLGDEGSVGDGDVGKDASWEWGMGHCRDC